MKAALAIPPEGRGSQSLTLFTKLVISGRKAHSQCSMNHDLRLSGLIRSRHLRLRPWTGLMCILAFRWKLHPALLLFIYPIINPPRQVTGMWFKKEKEKKIKINERETLSPSWKTQNINNTKKKGLLRFNIYPRKEYLFYNSHILAWGYLKGQVCLL